MYVLKQNNVDAENTLEGVAKHRMQTFISKLCSEFIIWLLALQLWSGRPK